MHASKSLACMRTSSHRHASTSSRGVTPCRCRCQSLQVHAALFEPPPFQPTKLTVQYLAGARPPNSLSALVSRRYTLTHNDISGALNLSIGSEYNHKQIQGFYTQILRDEITAEWYFTSGVAAPAELHIYCHVSGEERWLAPPQLRNFIFRREMTLVLDTFYHADAEFLQRFPDLMKAKVYVHFQSDVQDLDLREYWGTLGNRRSWRRMPRGVLARLKLLLFGFPALPHSRPRTSLTRQQQHRQQQQGSQGLVPLAAAAAADVVAFVQDQQQQRHIPMEPIADQTRPVALSLHQQRKLHLQEVVQLEQTLLVQSSNTAPFNRSLVSGSIVDRQQACALQQQKELEADACVPEPFAAAAVVEQAQTSNGSTGSSNGHRCSCGSSHSSSNGVNGCVAVVAAGPGIYDGSNSSSSDTTGTCVNNKGNGTSSITATPTPHDAEQLQQHLCPPEQLVTDHATVAPIRQQVLQRDQVAAFTDKAEPLQEYGYWLQQGGGSTLSSCCSSNSYSRQSGALMPVAALDRTVQTLQTVLQQQSMSRRGTVATAVAAGLRTGSSSAQSQW